MPKEKSISDAHKYIKLNRDDLIPYANNPRTHSESQVNQIAASIREFGFTVPVLVDGRTFESIREVSDAE